MNDKGRMPYPPQTQPPPYAPPAPQAYPEPAPQPYGFTANPPPTTSTVTVIQVPTGTILGPMSTCVTCPSCHAVVHTRVDHEPSSRTHMFAVLLCIFGLWPCCLFPYCMDSCQNSMHYCPACGSYLGSYKN
ncbi:lipopolysaccharide-induced tumor necrosis factor-alpha factor homolog isoform X2 [Hetaerina americana]|uniref:lipopolysaccharide-induced tumor necrosis factor-alpha factor homolog isoform X2 n=1 Tax=Hetaerina americana TaxID=62018 RepID=UPI003A7F13F6